MRIAVLGTGLMGSAIAEVLIRAGHSTVVYNRTAARAAPLVAMGATAAATSAEAIAAADVSFVVALDGNAARELLLMDATRASLAGRRILNFTTTTPDEILALARDVAEHGGDLAEASVTVYPDDVRRKEGHFVLGCRAADEAFWSGLLSGLGAYVFRAGDVGDASRADTPFIVTYILKVVAVAYAAAVGARLNVPAGLIRHQLTVNPTLAIPGAEDLLRQMFAGRYSESMASITTVAGALASTLDSIRPLGVPTAVLERALDLFAAASERGLGNADVAGVYEALLRPEPDSN